MYTFSLFDNIERLSVVNRKVFREFFSATKADRSGISPAPAAPNLREKKEREKHAR